MKISEDVMRRKVLCEEMDVRSDRGKHCVSKLGDGYKHLRLLRLVDCGMRSALTCKGKDVRTYYAK